MNYKIIRRKTNYIKLKVINRKVIVIAPILMPKGLIEKYVERYEEKLEKEMDNFKVSYLLEDEKINEVVYLGNKYILKLEKTITKIKLKDGFMLIPQGKREINKLVLDWYKEEAENLLLDLCEKWENTLKVTSNKIRLKLMKTRWGSCNYNKKYINLNIELMTKSIEFIDYVILHEYAHLFHPNHSKDFYNFIKIYKPNYKSIIKTQR